MVIDQIADVRAFASVQTNEDLVRMYVDSGQLSNAKRDDRPEVQLYQALQGAAPQRLHVVGASGAGKTGMILKVLGDLSALTTVDRPYETLIVNVGADPQRLSSDKEFMRGVVQQIAVQGHRWASVDQDRLRKAAADELTVTGPQVEHRAGIGTVFTYQAALKESYQAAKFGDNVDQARKDLQDVLGLVSKESRPLIVIDDTERFVSVKDGAVDTESVRNLYSNAIRALTDFGVDLVVGMHPHYAEVDAVIDVSARFTFIRIDVPALPALEDTSALVAILQRRIDRHGIDAQVEDVVTSEALAQLNGLYFVRNHDLRTVLNVADGAARAAANADDRTLQLQHVQPQLDRLPE